MIKLPKEVSNAVKELEKNGFKCYVVGGGVRDSLLGRQPLDWDLSTNAKIDDLKKIFSDAKVISQKFGVIRLDYTYEVSGASGGEDESGETGIILDIATFRKEGPYSDHRRPDFVEFTEDIEEDLKRRDFTINAIADNPQRGVVDPFGGRDDLKARLIKTIGEPNQRFKEDPLRIMRAMRLASELDMDLHKSVFEAIVAQKGLLEKVSTDRIREEFCRLVNGVNAGKGLKMLSGTGVMEYILGANVASKLSRREVSDFEILCEHVDRTKQVMIRRLGLFYICFDKKHAVPAIEQLNYDGETKQHLLDAAAKMPTIYFINNSQEFKTFVFKYGWDRYEYLHNLAKAQRLVYDLPENKVVNRNFIYDQIKQNREPIFIEDLAIDGNDLIEAGIAEGEKVGKILKQLAEATHQKPQINNREELLKRARKFSKYTFAGKVSKVKWIR